MTARHRTAVHRIAVIGDFMLDAYVRGSATRLCPDAPAPVLEAEGELLAAGGAGNVAIGCASRGLEVIACGFTGRDTAARSLETLLAEAGVRLDGLVAVPGRSTIVKRRYCAAETILLRVDEGTVEPVPARHAAKLDVVLEHLDAVIVSDYGYGSVTGEVLERIAAHRRSQRPMLLVDAKEPALYRDLHPDVVKPNYAQMLGLLRDSARQDRVSHVRERSQDLLEATGASAVIVTLDAEGAVLVSGSGASRHVRAPSSKPNATSGAGDTFLVALTSSLLTGTSIDEATRFATHTATSACTGTATVSAAVREEPPGDRGKRVAPREVAAWAERMRAEDRKVVLTNGCFDIFHAGHAEFLQAAAEAGDVLLVAVNTDESVRRLKGSDRPVNALHDRLRVLEAIGVVSAVTWFDDETAARVAAEVEPDVYVKGSDYRGMTFPEAELVHGHGGRVVFVDLLEGRSTTSIVNRMRAGGTA